LFVHSYDARFLPELSRAAAPPRPDAKPHVIDGERRRWNNVDDANERLHPIELAAHVFAKHCALQVRKDYFVLHRQLN
jgi:hypothetical protein